MLTPSQRGNISSSIKAIFPDALIEFFEVNDLYTRGIDIKVYIEYNSYRYKVEVYLQKEVIADTSVCERYLKAVAKRLCHKLVEDIFYDIYPKR